MPNQSGIHKGEFARDARCVLQLWYVSGCPWHLPAVQQRPSCATGQDNAPAPLPMYIFPPGMRCTSCHRGEQDTYPAYTQCNTQASWAAGQIPVDMSHPPRIRSRTLLPLPAYVARLDTRDTQY